MVTWLRCAKSWMISEIEKIMYVIHNTVSCHSGWI